MMMGRTYDGLKYGYCRRVAPALACVFFCGVAKSENRRALKRDARRRTTTTTTTMGDDERTTKEEHGDDCDLYHALGLARDATKLEVRFGFGWLASRLDSTRE